MTNEREMEALARDCVDAYAETVGEGWQQPATKGMRAVIELIARRLQPARVPERWRNVMQDLLRQFEKVGYDGDPTDPGYIAAKNARDMLATPAPESREAPKCPACNAAVLYECVACSNNNYPTQPEAGQRDGVEAWLDRDWPLWRNDPSNPNVARIRRAWDEARRLASAQQAGTWNPPAIPEGTREAAMVVIERDQHGKPTVWCDPEIVDLVGALNTRNLRTVASCSGHGGPFGIICMADGRELLILPDWDSTRVAERALREVFGGHRTDSRGEGE